MLTKLPSAYAVNFSGAHRFASILGWVGNILSTSVSPELAQHLQDPGLAVTTPHRSAIPAPPREGKGREGKGREGKGREGKGREGKGREGKGREGREGKGREGKGREGKGRGGEGKGREGKGREGKGGEGRGGEGTPFSINSMGSQVSHC